MSVVDRIRWSEVELPSSSRVVARLLSLLCADNVDTTAVAEQLALDPNLACRTLRLAGSVYVSGGRDMPVLADAVAAIEPQVLRTLINSVGVRSVFVRLERLNLRSFAWRSVMTAAVCRDICRAAATVAPTPNLRSPDHAYLAGLFHLLGVPVLHQCFPVEAAQGVGDIADVSNSALADRERALFGVSHDVVGAMWLARQNCSIDLVDAVRNYLSPPDPAAAPTMADLLRCAVDVTRSIERGAPLWSTAAWDYLARLVPERSRRQPVLEAVAEACTRLSFEVSRPRRPV